MKTEKFISLMREIVRTEIQAVLPEIKAVLYEELNSLKDKRVPITETSTYKDAELLLAQKTRIQKPKTHKVQKFSENSMLNSILNETAQTMTPIPDDMESVSRVKYSDELGSHTKKIDALPDELKQKGVTVEDLPESVQIALTKDYSLLMKKIKEKKGR